MAESVRFYLDQHIHGALAQGLRQRGVHALTAHEAGRCGLPDPEQLAFASEEALVLVTFDVDYLALHRSGLPHAGIAWCEATKHSIGELLRRLLLLHEIMDAEDMRNHLEYL